MAIHVKAERGKTGPLAGPKSSGTNSAATPDYALQWTGASPVWNFSTIPVSRAPISIQPKLQIGAVDDPLEREADDVAGRVMRMPDPSPVISNAATGVQRKFSCGGNFDKCRSDQDCAQIQQNVISARRERLDESKIHVLIRQKLVRRLW